MSRRDRHPGADQQPSPTPNGGKAIWELVIADMRERDNFGRAKYGTPLQAGNGRDALADAYQEALDLAVYLRQALEERDQTAAKLKPLPFDMIGSRVKVTRCHRQSAVGKLGTVADVYGQGFQVRLDVTIDDGLRSLHVDEVEVIDE